MLRVSGSNAVVSCCVWLSNHILRFLQSKSLLHTSSRRQGLSPGVVCFKIVAAVEELERFKVSKETNISVTASPREPFRGSVASAFCAVRLKWVKRNSAHHSQCTVTQSQTTAGTPTAHTVDGSVAGSLSLVGRLGHGLKPSSSQ